MDLESVRRYIYKHKLYEKTNKREVVYKRFYLYKYMREVLNMKYQSIAPEFNRKHPSVVKGYQAYSNIVLSRGYALDEFRKITEDVSYYFPLSTSPSNNNIERYHRMFELLGRQNKSIK